MSKFTIPNPGGTVNHWWQYPLLFLGGIAKLARAFVKRLPWNQENR